MLRTESGGTKGKPLVESLSLSPKASEESKSRTDRVGPLDHMCIHFMSKLENVISIFDHRGIEHQSLSGGPVIPVRSPFSIILLIIPPSLQTSTTVIHEMSSTSNRVAAFGGTPSLPVAPNASSGGKVNKAFSPFLIVIIP
nr:hypothetical protein Iba_chr14aCG19570 [Ipomoea batatas]